MKEEEDLKLEISCPKCKAKPLITEAASPEPVTALSDFVGRRCAACGHIFDIDDLHTALADATGEFLKGRFNNPDH